MDRLLKQGSWFLCSQTNIIRSTFHFIGGNDEKKREKGKLRWERKIWTERHKSMKQSIPVGWGRKLACPASLSVWPGYSQILSSPLYPPKFRKGKWEWKAARAQGMYACTSSGSVQMAPMMVGRCSDMVWSDQTLTNPNLSNYRNWPL